MQLHPRQMYKLESKVLSTLLLPASKVSSQVAPGLPMFIPHPQCVRVALKQTLGPAYGSTEVQKASL